MTETSPGTAFNLAGVVGGFTRVARYFYVVLVLVATLTVTAIAAELSPDTRPAVPRPDGKAANTSTKVKVFILMGQSNMLGMGRIAPGTGKHADPEGTLENAVKVEKKYPYLVDDAGNWAVWKDVRYVRVMVGKGGGMQVFNNGDMTVKTCKTIGPEFGIAHFVGDAVNAPVMILKSCIGNRSLGWDLLPPGSERFEADVTDKQGHKVTRVFAGYKDSPNAWDKGTEPQKINWYAGKQYDDDIANAKTVLADLNKYDPGAKGYEVGGFFFWQGDKDRYSPRACRPIRAESRPIHQASAQGLQCPQRQVRARHPRPDKEGRREQPE